MFSKVKKPGYKIFLMNDIINYKISQLIFQ